MREDIYTEEGLDAYEDNDSFSAEEIAFMRGYLEA